MSICFGFTGVAVVITLDPFYLLQAGTAIFIDFAWCLSKKASDADWI